MRKEQELQGSALNLLNCIKNCVFGTQAKGSAENYFGNKTLKEMEIGNMEISWK